MLVSGIKSRPVYGGLEAASQRETPSHRRRGRRRIGRRSTSSRKAPSDFLFRATILYVACGSAGNNHVEMLQVARRRRLSLVSDDPDPDVSACRYSFDLDDGHRLYVSGTEGFIGQMVQLALAHHIDHHSIVTEHRGSLARRVQCVHCKGITEERHDQHREAVPHCGLKLLVRDHYSRRLGASWVCAVDAEEPGTAPARAGDLSMSGGAHINVRVSAIDTIALGIKRFRLEPIAGGTLPPFSAGSHVVVTMNDGDKTYHNPYSLMGSPTETSSYQISVLKVEPSRGGSRFMHEAVKVGSTLTISHPVNLFPIDQRGRKHLLLAGGIGITPIMAMAEQLRSAGPANSSFITACGVTSAAHMLKDLRAKYGRRFHNYRDDAGQKLPLAQLLDNSRSARTYMCAGREA